MKVGVKKKLKKRGTSDQKSNPPVAEEPDSASVAPENAVGVKKKLKKKGIANKTSNPSDSASVAPEIPEVTEADEKMETPDVATLTAEAIKMIEENLSKDGAQKDGKAFVPDAWATKYKPTLGRYRHFIDKCSDRFLIQETGAGNFILKLVGKDVAGGSAPSVGGSSAAAPSVVKSDTRWDKELIRAWMNFCLATPKDFRDPLDFLGGLSAESLAECPKTLKQTVKDVAAKARADVKPAPPKGKGKGKVKSGEKVVTKE